MAKSKKKKHPQKKSQQHAPASSVNWNPLPKAEWLFMNPESQDGEKLYAPNDAPISAFGNELIAGIIQQQFNRGSVETFENIQAMFKAPNSKAAAQEKHFAIYLRNLFREFLGKHKQLDKTLNVYDPDSDWQSAPDIFDFRDYIWASGREATDPEKYYNWLDVLKIQTYEAVMYHDPSMLWTPNKYTLIQTSDSVFFILRRNGFNDLYQSVNYTCAAYKTVTLIACEPVIVPIAMFECDATIKLVGDMKETRELSDIEDSICSLILKDVPKSFRQCGKEDIAQILEANPESSISTVSFGINGFTTLWDISHYYVKYYKNMPSARENVALISALAEEMCTVNNKAYTNEQDAYLFIKEFISVPLACIMIFNALMRENKLRRARKNDDIVPSAVTHAKSITYRKAAAQDDKRQVRHIGNLHIKTSEKPQRISMERIIHFTKAEWNRAGHLRRTKTGKIVTVKPATVHRRCVTMENTNSASTGKTYIVHKPLTEN